jgi:hypothetical protein
MDLQVRRCRRASFIAGVPKIRASAQGRAASPAAPVTDFSGWTVSESGEVAEEVFRGRERACRSRTKENSVKHSEPVTEQPARPKRKSVLGRPRALTQAQIATILVWHDSRVTLKQLAASLGVSTSTVVHVIESRGSHYKQAPPEEREQTLKEHRAHCQALRDEHWL